MAGEIGGIDRKVASVQSRDLTSELSEICARAPWKCDVWVLTADLFPIGLISQSGYAQDLDVGSMAAGKIQVPESGEGVIVAG